VEVLWGARRQQQIPTDDPVRIGNTSVLPVTAVRDLGVRLDADVSVAAHVTVTVRTCFAALRQIRSVWRSLSRETLLTLIRALLVNKLDYCNSALIGVSTTLQRRLQSVLNAAAQLVFSVRRSEHETPHLMAQTSLVEGTGTNSVSFLCSSLRQCVIIPGWHSSPDIQRGITSLSPFWVDIDTTLAEDLVSIFYGYDVCYFV